MEVTDNFGLENLFFKILGTEYVQQLNKRVMMQRAPQPSCFDRVKVGFMIGFAVGMSSAALFGTYSAFK